VRADGKWKNVKVLHNSSNETLASTSLQSIIEANYTADAEDLAPMFSGDRMEFTMSFNFYLLAMFQLALFRNTLDFFVKGGVFMAVLLVCSFVALTVILFAVGCLAASCRHPGVDREGDQQDQAGRGARAFTPFDSRRFLASLTNCGGAVRPYNATKQETLEVVQSRARQEIVRLESGLFILEIVVGIAPLLGLLGAVTGLVRVFGISAMERCPPRT